MGLAVLELCFPSAGVLSFLAASAVLGAIIMGFMAGTVLGVVVLGVAVIGGPTFVVLAVKYWPNTAIGRRILLGVPASGDDVLPKDPQKEYLKSLIGQVVQTKCKMLPGGAVVVDGRTVDAVSEGMPIGSGEMVRVVEVRANRVVVRPLTDETPSPSAPDPLRRPIDAIADDPFEEEPPG
jgi:membrane-bound serine protease (ClpP class)